MRLSVGGCVHVTLLLSSRRWADTVGGRAKEGKTKEVASSKRENNHWSDNTSNVLFIKARLDVVPRTCVRAPYPVLLPTTVAACRVE